MRPSFFAHLHPPTLPEPQARLRYTLGAGGLAVFLTLVLIASGALEMFYYIPTAEQAAESIQTITFLVPLGGLVRGLHYWAGQALVAAGVAHLLRVVLTGSYAPPRRFNYWLGLGLLALVLLLDFTGYALRWDEGVRWAVVVGTELLKSAPLVGPGLHRLALGSAALDTPAVLHLYAWHIFGLMLPLIGVTVWHLFRVRRDGGLAAPPPQLRGASGRITRQELVRREALMALAAGALLLLLAAFVPAPLAEPMRAGGEVLGTARAPWFFLWVQALLRYGDPFWMGVFTPAAVLALLAGLPFWFAPPAEEWGRWLPPGGRGAQWVVSVICVLAAGLTALALRG